MEEVEKELNVCIVYYKWIIIHEFLNMWEIKWKLENKYLSLIHI